MSRPGSDGASTKPGRFTFAMNPMAGHRASGRTVSPRELGRLGLWALLPVTCYVVALVLDDEWTFLAKMMGVVCCTTWLVWRRWSQRSTGLI